MTTLDTETGDLCAEIDDGVAARSPLAGQAQLGADNTASSGWKARPPACRLYV
jgi:hypothetical protein